MTQKTITKKLEIREILGRAKTAYQDNQESEFWHIFEADILSYRVKFPLLEYVGQELYLFVPYEQQRALLDKIVRLDYEGGYVVVGIILQLQLEDDLPHSFSLAFDYIIMGNKWYVCDIISERVFGVALLSHFEESYPYLERCSHYPNRWIQRSVGIAIHYATKKGVSPEKVKILFNLIRQDMTSKDVHVQKGLGWALKTIAKFYPDIVREYEQQILDDPTVRQWYKNKVQMGLSQAKR